MGVGEIEVRESVYFGAIQQFCRLRADLRHLLADARGESSRTSAGSRSSDTAWRAVGIADLICQVGVHDAALRMR